jgi:hypothetical protein
MNYRHGHGKNRHIPACRHSAPDEPNKALGKGELKGYTGIALVTLVTITGVTTVTMPFE